MACISCAFSPNCARPPPTQRHLAQELAGPRRRRSPHQMPQRMRSSLREQEPRQPDAPALAPDAGRRLTTYITPCPDAALGLKEPEPAWPELLLRVTQQDGRTPFRRAPARQHQICSVQSSASAKQAEHGELAPGTCCRRNPDGVRWGGLASGSWTTILHTGLTSSCTITSLQTLATSTAGA